MIRLMARWSCSIDVIQILVLADLDRRVALGVEDLERSQIRSAFIDRDRLWLAVLIDRFFEIPSSCDLVTMRPQQEIDCVTRLVDCAV